MRRYDEAMAQVFHWVVVADAPTIRELAGRLLEPPHPEYPASGSSFAMTSILPTADWQLWLSDASHRRLQDGAPSEAARDEYLKMAKWVLPADAGRALE